MTSKPLRILGVIPARYASSRFPGKPLIDLKGKTTPEGLLIDKQERVTEYVLNKAKLALVPFGYFGADKESSWYRISVGCCKKEEIVDVIANLREALKQLV